ncbi:hypothetical protein Daura_24510 [Dactylosporangium aurantiacum]|uniref:Uncharacterized protein n=1 Tax=Dactylosporangium aurantiacum TaxID=35754 RepID=A0A9Q9IPU1_9ACTN|nr:hypothetical protein [Dactylosporangium aurantiacum]MDG6103742.1 hypothetical protein [Dactylosporangium aurantiacum]UWZ59043.1 hypothetical protein Daura_24510 [Dactylosporangium aurantiacum]
MDDRALRGPTVLVVVGSAGIGLDTARRTAPACPDRPRPQRLARAAADLRATLPVRRPEWPA